MKRRTKKPILISMISFALFLCLAFSLSLRVAAGEGDSPERFMDELRKILPDLVREAIPEDSDAEAVSELFGAEYLVSLLVSGIEENSNAFVSELLRLCGLVFISAAAMLMGKNIKNPRNSRLIESAVMVALASCVFAMLSGSLERAFAYLSDVLSFSNSLAPIMAGVYASGGSMSSAAVSTAVLGASVTVIENICVSALTPVVYVCFGFVAVSALGGDIDTSGIAKTVRHCYVTLLTLSCLILTAMLTFQSSIASASDSLAARTVKFAVGNLVPIVGGSVGDSLRTVAASLSLVKSTLGATAVIALVSIALPPLVSLLLSRFMLNITSGVARLLGCAKESRLLDDMRGIYDVMCAVVATTSVQFIIILTVFIKTTPAIA